MAKIGVDLSSEKVIVDADGVICIGCCNQPQDYCCFLDPDTPYWDSETTYAFDDIIRESPTGYLFKSLENNNLNHEPLTEGWESWWAYACNPTAVRPCGNTEWDSYPPFGGAGKSPQYYNITFSGITLATGEGEAWEGVEEYDFSNINTTHKLLCDSYGTGGYLHIRSIPELPLCVVRLYWDEAWHDFDVWLSFYLIDAEYHRSYYNLGHDCFAVELTMGTIGGDWGTLFFYGSSDTCDIAGSKANLLPDDGYTLCATKENNDKTTPIENLGAGDDIADRGLFTRRRTIIITKIELDLAGSSSGVDADNTVEIIVKDGEGDTIASETYTADISNLVVLASGLSHSMVGGGTPTISVTQGATADMPAFDVITYYDILESCSLIKSNNQDASDACLFQNYSEGAGSVTWEPAGTLD